MKIEDLPPLNEIALGDWGDANDLIAALEQRLEYAKELLNTEKDGRSIEDWHRDRLAFIEKLSQEGL